MRKLAALILLAALAACTTTPAPDRLVLSPVSFDDLKDWNRDNVAAALAAMRKSCPVLTAKTGSLGLAGKAADWRAPCAALQQVDEGDDAAARAAFETWFRPYAASGSDGDEGLFTGYYEPDLRGDATRHDQFQIPLYARPVDLIEADLGAFKSSLKGQRIVGKVSGQHFIPYDNRGEIAARGLNGRAVPLFFVDDAADAFFLQIQGSGRVTTPDGTVVRVGYDGANGRGYTAIGRIMAARGLLQGQVTMPAIRAWLAAHPDEAQQVMNEDESYVFFRLLKGDGPVGAEGVVLTAGRSLAIDPTFVPLGVPVWLEATNANGAPLRRLMIAQDTGGAIKGPVRGDVFWGSGNAAGDQAGRMQSRDRIYLLLPKTVTPDAS